MSETVSPLGRFSDAVAAIITTAVVLTFLLVHALLIVAPIVGLAVPDRPDTSQVDVVAVATIGYVLGGIGLGSRPTPAAA